MAVRDVAKSLEHIQKQVEDLREYKRSCKARSSSNSSMKTCWPVESLLRTLKQESTTKRVTADAITCILLALRSSRVTRGSKQLLKSLGSQKTSFNYPMFSLNERIGSDNDVLSKTVPLSSSSQDAVIAKQS